jgi:hypothetical protein
MKRGKYILTGIIALLTGVLFAQEQNTNCCKNHKPCVHITVHKQVDKDGNIVSYDSVYSYTFQGDMADTSFMNTIFNNGGITIQMYSGRNATMPDFMNDPFFQHFDMNMDMDNMQKMMQKEMQYMMQNAGITDLQQFFQVQPPSSSKQGNCPKQQNCPKKKCTSKHNNGNGGVQI